MVHLALYSDALTAILLDQIVLGLPRMGSVFEHEDGPVVVNGVPRRTLLISPFDLRTSHSPLRLDVIVPETRLPDLCNILALVTSRISGHANKGH